LGTCRQTGQSHQEEGGVNEIVCCSIHNKNKEGEQYICLAKAKARVKRLIMESDPIEVPIDGTLDLHHFRPKEIADLVREYVKACQEKEIISVRLIHGKGIGTLREIVHSTLRKMPEVKSFRVADETSGGWGATLVTLKD
tara:strand:- start:601 stop:1020 length:420 start_codon:yes stop_codon:yes gene_type:complete